MWTLYNNSAGFVSGIEFYDKVLTEYNAEPRLLLNRENLTHNYIKTLMDSSAFQKAGEFLDERATVLNPEDLKAFRIQLVIQEAQKVSRTSYTQALELIKAGLEKYGDDKDLTAQKNAFAHNSIADKIQKNNIEEAYTEANSFKEAGDIPESDWKQLVVVIYQKRANKLSADPLKAAALIQEGITEIGVDANLNRSYNVFIRNFEVNVHNAMVAAFNARDYAKAKLIVEEGLKQLPESKTLKSDWDLIIKASGN